MSAKFHFDVNLFRVIMTVDLTISALYKILYDYHFEISACLRRWRCRCVNNVTLTCYQFGVFLNVFL